jgi:chromosome segregation ATPase
MSGISIMVFVFFGALVVITMVAAWIYSSKASKDAKTAILERNEFKILYDQLRKEKFDLEDRISQIQGQERTYKVAYEDWKSKYALLEDKFQELKRDSELHATEDLSHLKTELQVLEKENKVLSAKIEDLESQLAQLKSAPVATPTASQDSKIVTELKSVLDQHLAIISNIIGDEKMEQYTQKNIPADPLHLIKGIDEDVSEKLQAQGIRTFDQIKNSTRIDVKKWMIEFDDIDEKIIESWPYQAEAIQNIKHGEHG